MPRTKEKNNPFGTILLRKAVFQGKNVTMYQARKRYQDINGNFKEKSKRCHTMSEAQTALVNFQIEINDELKQAKIEQENPVEHTFFELTGYYRREYLVPAKIVNGRKVEGYRQDLTKLDSQIKEFETAFGDISLSELTYEAIRRHKINLLTSPKKKKNAVDAPLPATVNRRLALLKKILNVGVQLNWLSKNPFLNGKALIETQAEQHRTRILTFEEEKKLLDACFEDETRHAVRLGQAFDMHYEQPQKHLYPILITALDTGMRKGEIFALERAQVDLKSKIISLRLEQTKSLRARQIPISDRLEKVLLEYFANTRIEKNDPIFLGVKNCRRAFESVRKRAKIDDFKFHDLRHTAITWFDEAGISEAVKKNIAGHSDGTTHQKYNNLSKDILIAAKAKIDAFRLKIDSKTESKVNKKVNKKKAAF